MASRGICPVAASWSSLPDNAQALIIHCAYENVWYDIHRGHLRLVCKQWASQVLYEAQKGINLTRPMDPNCQAFLLHKLPGLRSLNISFLNVETLQPVTLLTALTSLSLSLSSEPALNLAVLQSLPNLRRLDLLSCPFWPPETITCLSTLSALRSLHMDNVGDVGDQAAWLGTCTQLTEVSLGCAQQVGLPPGMLELSGLRKAAVVLSDSGGTAWLDGLQNLQELRALMLESHSEERIRTGLQPIRCLDRLKCLVLEDTCIVDDVQLLQGLTKLTCLGLRGSRGLWHPGKPSWMPALQNLRRLDLEDTRMPAKQMESLASLVLLRMLNLGHNWTKVSVAPLVALSGLQWLGLCGCRKPLYLEALSASVKVDKEEADLTWWFAEAG